jgi:hypothetical protein
MRFRLALPVLVAAILGTFLAAVVSADEGMWLFDHPPAKLLKEKYGFEPTEQWLTHLQRSAVRIGAGGSGSFVSPDGLVLTNHHVGRGALQQFSTPKRDLLQLGYYARTPQEELKCFDLEFNVLLTIDDVTDRVKEAVKDAKGAAEAQKLRRAVINTIEKEVTDDKVGMKGEVVTLYQGGLYHLYHYKKYNDVRLVFAPEEIAAFFGGDCDNFEYPRYDLDICIFRVYEHGKPIHPRHYLKWNPAGMKENDLVFVAGHPGKTERMNTIHHLEYLRDTIFPATLQRLYRIEVLASSFGQRSAENARRAQGLLLGAQNSRKARLGGLAGLQDPAVMNIKRQEEAALRTAAAADPKLAADFDAAQKTIDQSLADWAKLRKDYNLLEGRQAFNSGLFGIARALVRLPVEATKPNADRLHEFSDSGLASLKHSLFSGAPIYDDFETACLADSLSFYIEQKGAEDPLVKKVMAGKGPQARAAELVAGTKLAKVEVREQLADGGQEAIDASTDPMILLAKLVDEPSRQVRTDYEQKVEEPQRAAYGKLANIRFQLQGTDSYPDATFTLRLSYGQVKSCQEPGTSAPAPAWTTIGGMFLRSIEHNNADPFVVPQTWMKPQVPLDMSTPLNFVSTDDIIGGNSGSPVVNRNGEFVGIIFDGDLPSLVWDFVYTEDPGRAISVHGSAILEALRKIYDAEPLADELSGKQ